MRSLSNWTAKIFSKLYNISAILNLRQFVGAGQVGQDVEIMGSLTSHLSRPCMTPAEGETTGNDGSGYVPKISPVVPPLPSLDAKLRRLFGNSGG